MATDEEVFTMTSEQIKQSLKGMEVLFTSMGAIKVWLTSNSEPMISMQGREPFSLYMTDDEAASLPLGARIQEETNQGIQRMVHFMKEHLIQRIEYNKAFGFSISSEFISGPNLPTLDRAFEAYNKLFGANNA